MKLNSTLKLQVAGLLALLMAIFMVSVFLFIAENKGSRRVLYFEAMDGSGYYTESRRIMEYSPVQEDAVHVRQFVQELLLGPVSNRFRSLFPSDTRLESCLVQENRISINLSREALFPGATTSTTEKAVEMMTLNIEKNFPWIEFVEIYISGNKAYESVVLE